MNTGAQKSNPIPTRFTEAESAFLEELAKTTGLTKAELIRRAVGALRVFVQTRNVGAILELAA